MKQFVKAVGGKNHSVIYTDTDGRHFRFFDGTWAWRNHNPGNVRPGYYANLHNPIGATNNLAIFPDDQSGHAALLDLLKEKYGNYSIHRMIYKFAPPSENPTKKYEKYLHETIGIWDDTKIKYFTHIQFEKLWKAIQLFEGYHAGKIIEVHQVTKVKKLDHNLYQYYLNSGDSITEEKCISLAKKRKVELEVCLSDLGNTFLRSPPNSQFQKRLKDLE
jgi:hypothetical protein